MAFVLGCMACQGFQDEEDQERRPDEHVVNQFGFPARNWYSFASGSQLHAVIDEKEVKARLRASNPPLPQGTAVENAERLLLHEQGFRSPGVLLSAIGDDSGLLIHRLVAVGLPCHGSHREQAQRLLLMRTVSVRAMLQAAVLGSPADIAAVVRCVPQGQADAAKTLAPSNYASLSTHPAFEFTKMKQASSSKAQCPDKSSSMKAPSRFGPRSLQRRLSLPQNFSEGPLALGREHSSKQRLSHLERHRARNDKFMI